MLNLNAKSQMIEQYKSLLRLGAIDQATYDEQIALLETVSQAKASEPWDQAAYGAKPFAKSGYSYKGLEWFDIEPNARPKMCYFAVFYNKVLLIEWYADRDLNGIYQKTDQGFVLYSLQTVFRKRSANRDEFTLSPSNTKKVADPWHFERCCMYEAALAQRKFNADPKTGSDFWASKSPIEIAGKKIVIQAEAPKAEAPKAEAPKAEAPKAEAKGKKGK